MFTAGEGQKSLALFSSVCLEFISLNFTHLGEKKK